ncbi:MAG TPA: hypothetical protein VFA33_10950 [Bryobacteraceae bacterium]|nr:hypothetical protein [Bryobacteraceae bacterium]
MFCKPARPVAAVALAATLLTGCRGKQGPEFERVAVLRFENLTPDPALDWMGRGFAEVLTTQLRAASHVYAIGYKTLRGADAFLGGEPPGAPGVAAERQQALLVGANRLLVGQYSLVRGTLRVDAVVRDPATGRAVQVLSESGPLAEGMIPLAGRMARQVSASASSFSTRSDEALRYYAEACESADAAAAGRLFEQAVAADSAFGMAWAAAVELALAQHDRSTAESRLEQARARSGAFQEFDRAHLDLDAAVLTGDRAARDRALSVMSRLAPADPTLYRSLAEIALQEHRFRDSVAGLEKAAAIEPENIDTLNRMGYAAALAGDLARATQALRRYAALRPQEANPLDSLGDVSFYFGRLAEAEQFYLQAYGKSPEFLDGGEQLKAVYARLMRADLAGAGGLFARYASSRRRAGDPLLGFREAQWAWLTGQRRAALAEMEEFARRTASGPLRDVSSQAYARLVLWNLQLGDYVAARAHATHAAANAGKFSATAARIAQFLTQPEAGAKDWALRADRQFAGAGQEGLRRYALAHALLFARDFEAAAPVLDQLYRSTDPSADWELPVLLAWAYTATGRWQDAAPLVARNPIPDVRNLGSEPSLWFPRLFFLRAAVLERQGKRPDSRKNYQLFVQLSGPDPLIWGEEQRARRALGE